MMGWRTVEHSPLTQVNRAHIGSQRLVQQAWGPHGSEPCSLHICWCFGGTPNSGSRCLPESLPTLGTYFLLLECFVHLYIWVFILSCFVMLICSF